MQTRRKRDVRERFFEKVDTGNTVDGCWMWQAKLNHSGYGVFFYNGKDRMATRVSYELAYGPFDQKLFACHHCDTPACVNPSHIFIGTAKQNMQDCVRKGRFATHKGDANPAAKLTTAQVLRIRKLWDAGLYTVPELVKIYKVSDSTIETVIYRTKWTHI